MTLNIYKIYEPTEKDLETIVNTLNQKIKYPFSLYGDPMVKARKIFIRMDKKIFKEKFLYNGECLCPLTIERLREVVKDKEKYFYSKKDFDIFIDKVISNNYIVPEKIDYKKKTTILGF